MKLEDWEKLSDEEKEEILRVQPDKTLVVSEEDAQVSTIDRLLAAAPESIDVHVLHNLRQQFNSAVKRAESCEIKEMVSNLLLFAETADEVVDEMAWALRKDILQSSDYDKYVRLLGLFQRRTVPRTIGKILLEECKCGKDEPEEIKMGGKMIEIPIERRV